MHGHAATARSFFGETIKTPGHAESGGPSKGI